ncbi:hypothetical protein DPMN_043655 [Dreissena polymorpha]|uniref:Uncharacterized protein n=1 Tax=Dreissena polymorpha TaxID=45954 RepID=A0A9D4HY21_DREPO|nr:hypothetical protein DPMN_043655 [Dreissena polymorpha]
MPSWVQDLVVCACYVDSFPVQSAAISALLDLIILNQSLQRYACQHVHIPSLVMGKLGLLQSA